ncbi:MAG: NAD(P)/FAD-dependent oxidoreductase [Candidatus Omnitrophica bacterium]|jgi:geranylgeranyl reductase family protein|nr:NAD(P)/FAD-dependent oxidoreductase [Candidatus Omnitrophota bacterium]
MTSKIVIIGAGPIGCYLAQLLRKKGINSLLIEEHKEIGRPVHCAGLVGKKVFEEAKISLSSDCILNAINGAIVYAGKNEIFIKRKNVAYVVDREKFDKSLGKGLEIHFETRFLGLEKENGQYIIETDKGSMDASIIIGAEGARSTVREFVTDKRMEYLKGVQFRIKIKPRHKDMVEVYVKKPYFYWIIPESEEIVRIGVLSQNPYHDLLDFIKEKKLNGEILEKFAGLVPLTPFGPLSKEGIFLVGDSACQVKPLSYGGIYMGMRSAEILSECIVTEKPNDYNLRWMKRFGKEIDIALKARHIFAKLTDEDIEKIFNFVKKKTDIIEQKGDFENHATIFWEFLKHPAISKDVLGIMLKIIKNNLNFFWENDN